MREGWTYKKLGEVGVVVTGSTPSTKDEANYASPDYCFVKPSDLPSEGIAVIDESEFHISSKAFSSARQLPKGSVVVSCIGIIGKVGILNKDACTNQQINAIIPNDTILPKCLAYIICNNKRELEQIANAPIVPIINKSEFSKFSIPVPPLSEQQSIVAELDKINELISLKKAQLSDLDSLAQSIFYDMFGDPIVNEKGWEVKKLGDLCNKIGSGATPRGGNESYKNQGISLIRSMNVYNNEFRCKDLAFIDEEQADALSNVVVFPQDILLNITGASVARCCIVPDDILPARVNQHVCIIRPKSIADSIYLNYMLTNDSYQNHLLSLARSKAATREALPKSIVEDLHIPLPPLPLQQEFAKRIELIEQQKAQISSTIKDLETLLASRMQYWFD